MCIPGQVVVCVETLSLALLCGYSFSISKAIKGPKESTPLGFWFFVWDFFFICVYFLLLLLLFTQCYMKKGGRKPEHRESNQRDLLRPH